MELLCPECMNRLATADGKTARCAAHGTEFRIMFSRDKLVPDIIPQPQSADAPPVIAGSPSGNPYPGMHCVQHPQVDAAQQCQSCGAYMCATCDFALPGGIHLCPACATKPQTALSPKRRRAMIWSYVLAAFSTFGFVFTMTMAVRAADSPSDLQGIGVLMFLMVLIPSIVGISFGWGNIDRRLANPLSLWGAAIWNGLVIVVFLLLSIVGSLE